MLAFTRKKIKGGKYIGQGTYGCGFIPALRCKGKTKRQFGLFSKLMRRREALLEYAKVSLLKPVDPKQQYILYPLDLCTPNLAVLGKNNPENNVGKCKGIFQNISKDSFILQYVDGGSNLLGRKFPIADYVKFFESLQNLFDGLELLHSKKLAHLDIKAENVVTNKVVGGYHTRLIDVGFVTDVRKRYSKTSPFNADYYVWPYEVRFTHPSFRNWQIDKYTVESFYAAQGYQMNYCPPEVFKTMNSTFKKDAAWYEGLFNKVDSMKTVGEYQSLLLLSADVFSLGRLLSYLYANLVGHYSEYSLILIRDAKTNSNIPLSEIETIHGTKIYECQKAIADNVSKPMYALIKRMMELDPYRRITMGEASRAYKVLIPLLREYLKAEILSPAIEITHPGLPERSTQPSPFLVVPVLPPSPPTPVSSNSPPAAVRVSTPILQIAKAATNVTKKKKRIFKVVKSQFPFGSP